MPDHDLYARLYEAEWQRRDQLESAAGMPLGLLVLLGSGLFVLVQRFGGDRPLLSFFFWPLFAVACGAFGVTGYLLARSVHRYEYVRIPLASELATYQRVLDDFYAGRGTPELSEGEFRIYLQKRYVRAAEVNAVNNVNRAQDLRKANRSLLVALLAAAAASVPFTVEVRTSPAKPQQVEIIQLEGRMSAHEKPMPKPPATPRDEANPIDLPPKPKGPENFVERAGMKLPPTHDLPWLRD